jgi:hypothetical protein
MAVGNVRVKASTIPDLALPLHLLGLSLIPDPRAQQFIAKVYRASIALGFGFSGKGWKRSPPPVSNQEFEAATPFLVHTAGSMGIRREHLGPP